MASYWPRKPSMLQGVVGATHHDPAGGLEWVSDELGRRRRGGKDVKNNFFRFVCVCVLSCLAGWLGSQLLLVGVQRAVLYILTGSVRTDALCL